jgi:hypothetical protein
MISTTTPARHNRPLWVVVLLFLLACASLSLLATLRRPKRPSTPTLSKLAERIKQEHPEWHIVSTARNGDLSWGFYVCNQPRERSELQWLPLQSEQVTRWRGVVLVAQTRNKPYDDWGEYGRNIGLYMIFGDPKLLRPIESMLE